MVKSHGGKARACSPAEATTRASLQATPTEWPWLPPPPVSVCSPLVIARRQMVRINPKTRSQEIEISIGLTKGVFSEMSGELPSLESMKGQEGQGVGALARERGCFSRLAAES
jgi:hypothetical protein